MSKYIEVEYYADWAFATRAIRIGNILEENFSQLSISYKSSEDLYNKIEVSWIKDGVKEVVWSGGRQEATKDR